MSARSRSTDRRYYGVVEALVEDVDDDAHEGRVKVKFPWFDEGMITEWCRVRQLYAGNDYGTFFIPEKGDEVLVAFVHGDMRMPVILGGLYNGSDKPPSYRDSSTKDEKLIRTKGQHELLFDDSSSKEKIRLKTKEGHVLLLDDANKKISITTKGGHDFTADDDGKKVTITTTNGNTLVFDDQGKKIDLHTVAGAKVVLDDSGTKITVEVSGQTVTLEASGITLKGTKVTVQATQVLIEAPKVELGSSGAQALVMGPPFMALFNAHTHNCTAPGAPTGPPLAPFTPAMQTNLTKAL